MYVRAIRLRLVKVVDRSAVVPDSSCRFEWRRREGKRSIPGAKVTARRMDLPLRAVARALDLPIATRPAGTRWLTCDQLDVIDAATGVSSSVVEALTLSAYDGTALQLTRPQFSPS